jgi:hypothetical protein
MKTCDFEQVSATLEPLKAKFKDCAHGEGNACEKIDNQLDCCAEICFQMVQLFKQWSHGVFCGAVLFDPASEKLWQAEIVQIYLRAVKVWQSGRKAEIPCYELPGQNKLSSALWHLNWLLEQWVTPKLSVGPAARRNLKLTEEQRDLIRKQLAALPRRAK